jgi:endonuclease/exonuclease/phosphatase family metal-dependent hydrolase
VKSADTSEHSPLRLWIRRAALALGAAVLAVVVLFAWNGLGTPWRTPAVYRTAAPVLDGPAGEVRVLALNLAKGGFHRGGLDFADTAHVRARLERVAEAIRAADVQLVLLSEVVHAADPAPVDQSAYLAAACGYAFRATSDNYSFGVPWYRIRSGNAVLSRVPLRPVAVQDLAGSGPFWNPTNHRRALWCEVRIGEEWLLVGSLRNDSYDLANNARQSREILDFAAGRPALLGGDFNAEPHDESMRLFAASGAFTPVVAAPPTFPVDAPADARRRIDHVLAPAGWELVEHRVLDTGASDHLAVVATFAVTPR